MSQRIFILGAGRFGVHLASRLCEFGCEVILADANAKRVEDLADEGYNTIQLDADNEEDLRAAGVVQADIAVVAIGENMQASILATLLLKELKVKRVIARAVDDKHAQVLEKVGADLVVVPGRDMAYRLAERLRSTSLSDRLPLLGEYQLAHIRLGHTLQGQTLGKAQIPQRYHLTVTLIIHERENLEPDLIEPQADSQLRVNDVLIVVGKREDITHFESRCGLIGADNFADI